MLLFPIVFFLGSAGSSKHNTLPNQSSEPQTSPKFPQETSAPPNVETPTEVSTSPIAANESVDLTDEFGNPVVAASKLPFLPTQATSMDHLILSHPDTETLSYFAYNIPELQKLVTLLRNPVKMISRKQIPSVLRKLYVRQKTTEYISVFKESNDALIANLPDSGRMKYLQSFEFLLDETVFESVQALHRRIGGWTNIRLKMSFNADICVKSKHADEQEQEIYEIIEYELHPEWAHLHTPDEKILERFKVLRDPGVVKDVEFEEKIKKPYVARNALESQREVLVK